jgi:exodeoxyribonuclease VII large subunit
MTLPALPTHVKPDTVSGLTGQMKSALEASFGSVWVVGEIAQLTVHGSGHTYLSLKDKDAVLPAVIWRTTAQRLRYAMKAGMEVAVRGRITIYAPQGKYQLTIDEMYQTGVGAQDLALRKLKEKLQKLGYFALERKKPLPRFPRRLALVASPTGAAVRDMLEIISRRWPRAEIWVVGVRVQGPGAPESIAAALTRLNEFAGIDAILLGRGGGSREDLAAFNEELVAHAIFASRIPVISAVGHEIDVTLADLVADRRASTPSEAAELATPSRDELMDLLSVRQRRLRGLLLARYQASQQRLNQLAQRRVFRFPLEFLRDQERRLDVWEERLSRLTKARADRLRLRLDALTGKLESLSPLNVLARGYSLTRTLDKKVVRSIDQTQVGDTIEIVLADGQLQAEVKAKS